MSWDSQGIDLLANRMDIGLQGGPSIYGLGGMTGSSRYEVLSPPA